MTQRKVKILDMPLTFILTSSNKSDDTLRKEFLKKYKTFNKDEVSKREIRNQKKYEWNTSELKKLDVKSVCFAGSV